MNKICLCGLSPFLYSVMYNTYNRHSLCIFILGVLYHSNPDIQWLRILDIFTCFLNGGIVFYQHPPSRIYGLLSLCIYIMNKSSNNKIHLLVQYSAWKGIHIYEKNKIYKIK